MPLLRKIIKVGNSRAIVIPDDWLQYQEQILGNKITQVGMECNEVIIIKAIIHKEGAVNANID